MDPPFPAISVTGILGASAAEEEQFEGFANEAACPALDPATGRCDVYAWRPMTCRVFGPPVRMGDGDALGCCELCFVGATEDQIAACEMPIPHDLEAEIVHQLEETGEALPQPETVVAFAAAAMTGAPHDKLEVGKPNVNPSLLGRDSYPRPGKQLPFPQTIAPPGR